MTFVRNKYCNNVWVGKIFQVVWKMLVTDLLVCNSSIGFYLMPYILGQLLPYVMSWGTMPVSNDLFIMCVMGLIIIEILSFNNLVDMPSWPWLVLFFHLTAVLSTSDVVTGPRNILCVCGMGMHCWKHEFTFGTLWLVWVPILAKYLLKLSAICNLSVICVLFIVNEWVIWFII